MAKRSNNGRPNDAESRKRHDDQDVQLPDRSLTLEFVHQSAIDMVWTEYGVGQLFRGAEKHARETWNAETLYSELQNEEQNLWLVLEDSRDILAALVTDTRPFLTGARHCTITIIVGKEPRSWIRLISELEDWAKRSGCSAVTAIGRVAWKGLLPSDYKVTALHFEKHLDHGQADDNDNTIAIDAASADS